MDDSANDNDEDAPISALAGVAGAKGLFRDARSMELVFYDDGEFCCDIATVGLVTGKAEVAVFLRGLAAVLCSSAPDVDRFVTPDEHNSSVGRSACLLALDKMETRRCQLESGHAGGCAEPTVEEARLLTRIPYPWGD